MNKICTSQEQSQKLIELGIDVNTADMCWTNHCYGVMRSSMTIAAKTVDEYKSLLDRLNNSTSIDVFIPAWSLTALLRLMSFHIIENNNRFGFYQVKGFNKQGETYRFGYKTNNDSFLFETSWYNDVIDGAFEMVCWLKENKKL